MFLILVIAMLLFVYFILKQHIEESTPTRRQPKATREKPLWFKKEEGKYLFDKRGNEVAVSAPVVLNPGNFVVEYQKGSWEIYQVTGAKVRGAKLEKVGCPDILKEPLQRKGIFCW